MKLMHVLAVAVLSLGLAACSKPTLVTSKLVVSRASSAPMEPPPPVISTRLPARGRSLIRGMVIGFFPPFRRRVAAVDAGSRLSTTAGLPQQVYHNRFTTTGLPQQSCHAAGYRSKGRQCRRMSSMRLA